MDLTASLVYNTADSAPSAVMRVTCEDSGITLVEFPLTGDQLVCLLSSRHVVVPAQTAPKSLYDKIGKHRVHEEFVPDPAKFPLRSMSDSPSVEMIYAAEAYRVEHGWETATWHVHEPDTDIDTAHWCLHLVRWEPADSTE